LCAWEIAGNGQGGACHPGWHCSAIEANAYKGKNPLREMVDNCNAICDCYFDRLTTKCKNSPPCYGLPKRANNGRNCTAENQCTWLTNNSMVKTVTSANGKSLQWGLTDAERCVACFQIVDKEQCNNQGLDGNAFKHEQNHGRDFSKNCQWIGAAGAGYSDEGYCQAIPTNTFAWGGDN